MSRVLTLPTPAFIHYQAKRLTNLRALGPALRLDAWLQERGVKELGPLPAARDWMAFHPWRPGWLALAQTDVEALRAGRPLAEIERLGWLSDGPVDLDGLCLRAIHDFGALQNPRELRRFLERAAVRRPRTVVEIGTSAGGLLFAIAQVADPGATLVSIDLPDPPNAPILRAATLAILASLVRPDHELVVLREPSTHYGVREDTRRALGGRSVDLLVIDGDHSYGGVRSDYEMYSPLVAPGGLIAFHDVLVRPENSGRGFDVGIFWQELVAAHRTETLADDDGVPGLLGQKDVPFAERRPAALGWGLVAV